MYRRRYQCKQEGWPTIWEYLSVQLYADHFHIPELVEQATPYGHYRSSGFVDAANLDECRGVAFEAVEQVSKFHFDGSQFISLP